MRVFDRIANLTGAKTTTGGAERASRVRCALESLLSYWAGPSQSNSSINIKFLVCLLLICGATAFVGVVPTKVAGHDDFFLLEHGWRIFVVSALT